MATDMEMADLLLAHHAIPTPATVRPIMELLTTPPPQEWADKQCFFKEIGLAWDAFKQAHPLGLRREELDFDLNVPDNIYEVCAKKLAVLVPYFQAWHGFGNDLAETSTASAPNPELLGAWLETHSNSLHLWELSRHLSLGEIARMVHHQINSGNLLNDIRKHPVLMYVTKIALSAFHWQTPRQTKKIPWQRVLAFHKIFQSFDFRMGFEVTIDHSTSCNDRGYGEYTREGSELTMDKASRTFLDGEFGFIISHQGKHLMTIGVAPNYAGLLVNQIQLKHKKGNRWLYKLPKPYFEYALDRLLLACKAARVKMYLATGESLSSQVQKLYPDDKPWNPEVGDHIVRTYNQPLCGLRRSRRSITANGLKYHQVIRITG